MTIAEAQKKMQEALTPADGIEMVSDVEADDIPAPVRIKTVSINPEDSTKGCNGHVEGEVYCPNPNCNFSDSEVILKGWPAG